MNWQDWTRILPLPLWRTTPVTEEEQLAYWGKKGYKQITRPMEIPPENLHDPWWDFLDKLGPNVELEDVA